MPVRLVKEKINGNHITLHFYQIDMTVKAFFSSKDLLTIYRTEVYYKGELVREDFYLEKLLFSEFFGFNENKQTHRTFYNRDGSETYTEIMRMEDSVFKIGNNLIFSKQEMLGFMFEKLDLSCDDIIILDRLTTIAQPILDHKGQAKLLCVVHAEHYNVASITEHTIFWNNFYDYAFTNASYFDAFLTSTNQQTQLLQEQLKAFTQQNPKIATIPVGAIEEVSYPVESRQPFFLVTVSRMSEEKHIDWMIEVVIKSKKQIPQLTFTIFGNGVRYLDFLKKIEKAKATRYIFLKDIKK